MTLTYSEWHGLMTSKVKNYDWYTCRRALFDCHDTMSLHRDAPHNDEYVTKLWAEIDALRERQHALAKLGQAPVNPPQLQGASA
jgi:hypothetical protein